MSYFFFESDHVKINQFCLPEVGVLTIIFGLAPRDSRSLTTLVWSLYAATCKDVTPCQKLQGCQCAYTVTLTVSLSYNATR